MLKTSRFYIIYAILSFTASLFAATVVASAQVPLSEINPGRTSLPPISADDRIAGKADAPITIIEYASLTCPHCAVFNAETTPKVKAAWIDTGKARLVFRDYPLDGLALKAAMIARCAPADRFFDIVDALFKEQKNWAQMKDQTQALAQVSKLAGLDKQQADACVNDSKLADFVAGERLHAGQFGVDATPTFFINGKKLVGEVAYSDFEKALQAASTAP